jgi:hypothetical protein
VDDFERKQNLSPPGFEPCAVQPVANRSTDFPVQVLTVHFVSTSNFRRVEFRKLRLCMLDSSGSG